MMYKLLSNMGKKWEMSYSMIIKIILKIYF